MLTTVDSQLQQSDFNSPWELISYSSIMVKMMFETDGGCAMKIGLAKTWGTRGASYHPGITGSSTILGDAWMLKLHSLICLIYIVDEFILLLPVF